MMELITAICSTLVKTLDGPLGWLLAMPRDLAIVAFATLTALLMTVARRYVTNQNLLHRCSIDLKRLKDLVLAARNSQDKASILRFRTTMAQIKGIQLAADLRVLVVVIVPLGVLAIWATERFDYLPIALNDDIAIRACFPVSSIGRVTHVVPDPAFELLGSPVAIVAADPADPTRAVAEWTLRPRLPGDHSVLIRHERETGTHTLKFGGATYEPPVQIQKCDRISSTEVGIRRYLPLGFSMGGNIVNLPPWLIGYLMLTLGITPVIKRLLQVS
jgi:hypothetical protein